MNSLVTITDDSSQQLMFCEYGSLDDNTRIKTEQVINHLEIALRYDPSLVHAYLLLGQAYCIQGEPEYAIPRLKEYINLKPRNPLGYLWKGFAYEALMINCERSADCLSSGVYRNEMIAAWKQAGLRSEDFYESGDELRRVLDFSSANEWYQRGSSLNSDHKDDIILQEDDITIIEDFKTLTFWKPCDWCDNVEGEFIATDGILTVTYVNDMDERDMFGYRMLQKVPLNGYEDLILKVKGEPGTLLTLEAVIDKERERYVNYRSIQSDWEVLSLPISGEVLSEVTIFISEYQNRLDYEQYKLYVDWIGFSQ